MILEEVGEDVEPVRRLGERLLRMEIGGMGPGKALLAFEKVGPAGKPARRQPRRQEAVLRRLPGVERLAHRAELRFEPGCLGSGDAERLRRGLGVEPHQVRAGRRRAERADRAGRVKAAAVMPGPDRHADPATGLVAGDKGGDDIAAGAAALFGERQEAGQDRHRGVPRHRQVDVVVIERVADRAVDEGGRQHRQPRLVADHPGLRRAARVGHLVEQDGDQRIVGPGERHPVIIEHALPRQRPHRLGQRIVADRRSLSGEGPGQICRVCAGG